MLLPFSSPHPKKNSYVYFLEASVIKLTLMKVLKMNQLTDNIYSSAAVVPYGFFGKTSCFTIRCHCKTS